MKIRLALGTWKQLHIPERTCEWSWRTGGKSDRWSHL